jgi:pyruvate,water dikinase
VKGKVRIILNPLKEHNFKEGEILITGMTRPEYLPLVNKCLAFITDAGGILSHAAITARELKKPCIIGTQVATTFLKDGDFVEVDADEGVVRILEQ